ncbi:MAG TPA: TolC family protein, partial [Anaeromyxobacter sp.]
LAAALGALAAGPGAARAAPLTLDDALAVAARESTDLAAARADVRSAAADRLAGVGGVLPRLDLSTSIGHQFVGPTSVVFLSGIKFPVDVPATDQGAYALQLQLAQPLFDWATFREVARARWSDRAASRQYDEVALSVAFEVTRRFYEVVRAERALAVLEKTAARSEDLVGRADALFAAGRAPKSDAIQARVNLSNDRISVEGQRIRLAQARSALAQALGQNDGSEIEVVAPASLEPAAPAAPEPPPVQELLGIARARRPALAAQAALVSAAEAAASGARGGWLPTVSAQASWAKQGAELASYEGVYGDPSRAYVAVAQLVLTWNLFEGGRTLATQRRADAAALHARAIQGRTEAMVAKEIVDARAAATSLSRQVALATDALAVATQGLELARQRLEAGLANQLEVRDASLKLTQAELSLVQARIDHAIARADLARAAGGPY